MGTAERIFGDRVLSEQKDGCLREATIEEVVAFQDFGFQVLAMARDEERRNAKHCPYRDTPQCSRNRASGVEK